jgi:hypothetical protein
VAAILGFFSTIPRHTAHILAKVAHRFLEMDRMPNALTAQALAKDM